MEGVDPEGRYFNRNAEIHRHEKGYRARLQHEGWQAEGEPALTVEGALTGLAQALQGLGFRKLRSRVNFKGKRYLAEHQPWVDYPEPVRTG